MINSYTISAIAIMALNSCSIKIPYFDKLSYNEVCGGHPKKCQPQSSKEWDPIEPGVDFSGDYSDLLGQKYNDRSSIFETSDFVDRTSINSNSYEIKGKNKIEGRINKTSKNDFKAALKADILKLFSEQSKANFSDVDINLDSQITSVIDRTDISSINLEYKRVDLTKRFINTHITPKLTDLSSKDKVITGISLITVEGNWSRSKVTELFAQLEATGEYRTLTSSAKNNYKRDKNRILNGKFESLQYCISAAYRRGLSDPNR